MSSSSASVLIIDDEPVVRESLAMDLKRGGYDLFFAQNGAEGIDMVSNVTPSVIILDLRMPVMNGAAAMPRLPNMPFSPSAYPLLLTVRDISARPAG